MRTLLLAATLGLTLGFIISACGKPPCTTNAQCATAEICLPSGLCASTCMSDAQCSADHKCSAGGCVSRNGGCATNADCTQPQVCLSGGSCGTPSSSVTIGHGADGGSCGGQKYEATRTEANMLIVLDHSGSMMEVVGGAPKWTAAVGAVKALTQANPDVRFGFQYFSLSSAQCQAGSVQVPIGAGTAAAIAQALPARADGNGTPIAGALDVAAAAPGLDDTTRANYVLLITDGKENCGGNPVTKVQGLFTKHVKSWVVGFGGDVDQNTLNQMAIKGGTARLDARRYYQADDPNELSQALSAIANGSIGCDFGLAQVPPDATKLFVAIDGQFVPRDSAHVTGYDYSAATNRLTLYGPACDALANTVGAKLSIIYGCPDDTLVETGPNAHPDGGFVFALDGGEQIN